MIEKPYLMLFEAPKAAEDIGPFVDELVRQTKGIIPLSFLHENKLRFIVIELCTNYIKHGKKKDCFFEFKIGQGEILIRKEIKGQHFKGNLLDKLGDAETSCIKEIFFSETNNHYIEVVTENKFRFLDPIKLGLPTDSLKDHFGLHIITVCSEDFIYEFEDDDETEVFSVILKV